MNLTRYSTDNDEAVKLCVANEKKKWRGKRKTSKKMVDLKDSEANKFDDAETMTQSSD